MCGSDTLTTVVSSTSMKVLDMTATAISHGLMLRCDWVSRGIRIAQFQTVCRDSEMNPILEYTVGLCSSSRLLPGGFGERVPGVWLPGVKGRLKLHQDRVLGERRPIDGCLL